MRDISSLSSFKVNSGLDSHRWIIHHYFWDCFRGIPFNLILRLKGVFAKADGFWRGDPSASALEGVENRGALKVTDLIWLFKSAAVPEKCSSFTPVQTPCGESQLVHFKGQICNERSMERLWQHQYKSCWLFLLVFDVGDGEVYERLLLPPPLSSSILTEWCIVHFLLI